MPGATDAHPATNHAAGKSTASDLKDFLAWRSIIVSYPYLMSISRRCRNRPAPFLKADSLPLNTAHMHSRMVASWRVECDQSDNPKPLSLQRRGRTLHRSAAIRAQNAPKQPIVKGLHAHGTVAQIDKDALYFATQSPHMAFSTKGSMNEQE
ncbi:hypothetical protein [Noviherbaspirillum malthae]|uniref:hypothetical protein n=1 Tax=Noviherbaspirillum malthae TaxID=1260987 RepID=UPI00188F1DA2|nr:hypothetical protein [Noviherbaspirillum malthae]